MKTKKIDSLHKYLVLDKQARVITTFTTDVVNEYAKNVNTTPLSIVTMGRLLTSALMMGSLIKGNESILITINGNGPIGTIAAEADAMGHVRGYASNPNVNLPLNDRNMLDVAGAVGTDGYLQVRKQMNMKEPFVGTCELVSGEIGEDLSYYFGTSEQTPTIVALGVLANEDGTCKQAGGFLIQLLPNAKEEAYEYLENILKNLTSVSKLISECESEDKLVDKLFDKNIPIFDYPVSYKCSCSLSKTKMLLTQLKEEDLQEDIKNDKGLDVTCNFCNKVYHITTKELEDILADKKAKKYKVK